MRHKVANNLLMGGIALFLTGILIVAFSPVNLTIFTQRIAGPTAPVGIIISLVGFVLTVVGGYFKVRV